MIDPLRMAVGTLTAVPVPAPRTIDSTVAGRAMLLAPLAVLPLAAAACVIVAAGQLVGLFPLATAVLAVGTVALGSRGLHLDGLADTADGLSASYDRERALSVMRRGDVGPMGVVTVVFVVLGQVAALTGAIVAGHGVFAAAAWVLVSRLMLAVCCMRGVPPARTEGLGSAVAGTVAPWQGAVALTGGLVLAALAGALAGLPLWRGALAVALATACAAALLARCVQRLGGSTGDVLGGCVEVAALGTLVALAG